MKKNRRLNWKKDINDGIFYAIMVSIPTLNFILLYLGVNINSILLSFKQYTSETEFTWVWLDNFKRFFQEFNLTMEFKYAFTNSFKASLYSFVLGISLSLIFSIYIYHKKFGHAVFKVILFLPSVISSIVMVTIFRTFCNDVIPAVLNDLLYDGKKVVKMLLDQDTGYSVVWPMLIFYNLWVSFGSSILLYVGAMSSISDSVSEAAHLDGANIIQESLHITLPLIFPTITILFISMLTGIFTGQLNLYTFYGIGAYQQYRTIGYWLYVQVKNANGSVITLPYLSSIGLLCTCVCVPLTLGLKKLLEKIGPKFE